MTLGGVGHLYDALVALEGKRRGWRAYPVHKRLSFGGIAWKDVYEWLGDDLALKGSDRVLDVGCGVGYGTLHLAERGVARAVGLSISEDELRHASRACAHSRWATAVEFVRGSFDRPPPGPFDVIVAVESLKHSTDLCLSMRGLRKALAPGGRLVIVEDLFDGDEASASARCVASDWMLSGLYSEADYREAWGSEPNRVVDLTSGVQYGRQAALALRLAALNLTLPLQGRSRATALRAYRGGVHLERLYAAGAMRYVAMFWSEGAAASA